MDDATQKLGSEAGALREAARVLRGEFQPLVNRVPDWRNVERQLLEAADALEAAQRPPVSPEVRQAFVNALEAHGPDAGVMQDGIWLKEPCWCGSGASFSYEHVADALLAQFSVPSQPVYDEEKIARFLYLHRVSDQAADTAPAIAVICDDAARALVAALRGGELTREETP